MYAVSPVAVEAWKQIFRWVESESGIGLDIIDYPAPAPLVDLWNRSDLGAVFMCGWPYAKAGFKHNLIVAPVPASDRCFNKPIYFTDFVVKRESSYLNLSETFDDTLAWTVDHSHSGYNAVRYHLLSYLSPDRTRVYAKTLGPLFTPDGVIQSVLSDQAQVGPVDSLVFDIWRTHGDERATKCRILESSNSAPIPPLVASPKVDIEICRRLQEAFLHIHKVEKMEKYLRKVAISRFSLVEPSDYQILLDRAKDALLLGYPALG